MLHNEISTPRLRWSVWVAAGLFGVTLDSGSVGALYQAASEFGVPSITVVVV